MPLTPETIAAPDTEHAHQAAVFQWIALTGRLRYVDIDMLHAIPNGADYASSVTGSRMKAEGLKPGVPDMHLPVPAGPYPGLYIELKKPSEAKKKGGGVRDNQTVWHKRLRGRGFAVVVAYGWAAAVVALELYYNGALVMPKDDGALIIKGQG